MKLTHYFDAFMKNTVNLDDYKLRSLKTSVDALYGALQADTELGPIVEDMDPQGSWAQKTIIKQVEGKEFDADFMIVLTEQEGWTPKQYINAVFNALRRNGNYKDKVKKKNRCVRVTYANDYHVDIVPFLCLSTGRQVICNAETDEWEDTDPDEFTAWMKRRDDTAKGNLRRTIRLMKYLRDHRLNFRLTRSVILTVLLGERVDAGKKITDPNYYGEIPNTFVHIVEDLNDWLQARPTLPPLPDPSGANNDFGHRWTQDSYDNLRAKVKTLAADARAALDDDEGHEESAALWQNIFGPEFKRPPDKGTGAGDAAGAAGAGAVSSVQSGRDG